MLKTGDCLRAFGRQAQSPHIMEKTMPNSIKNKNDELYSQIASVLSKSRQFVVSTVNTTMVRTYFEIGRIIVENEQNGKSRAEYGKETLKNLSERLTKDFGKGFSVTNLKQMRDFFLTYQNRQTVSDQFSLSWSHAKIKMMRLWKSLCRKTIPKSLQANTKPFCRRKKN